LGPFRYKIMSSVNKDSLTSSPICIYFISFSCLLLWVGIQRLCWTRVERLGTLVLISMMLGISLSYIAFILFKYITSIPSFIRAFIMRWCSILPNF
jgi:hypothetical protein